MARLIMLPTRTTVGKGQLTVIEKILPFSIERVYFIHQAQGVRGGHRHKVTAQALVAVAGSCRIYNHNGADEQEFLLDQPEKLLLLDPPDWHEMFEFSSDCVLLVLASHEYNPDDYIDERY